MCGIIGYVGRRPSKELLSAASSASSIGATTRRGSRCSRTTASSTSAPSGTSEAQGRGRRTTARPRHRSRPHALGDTRRRERGQRAPADGLRRRQAGDRPQRDRRELPRAEGRARGRGHTFSSETDAEVVAHLLETRLRRRPRRGRPHGLRATSRATSPSSSSTTTSRTGSSACAARRRSWSASATARTSSPRTSAAFLAETRRVHYPGHGDVVEVTPRGRPRSSAPRTAARSSSRSSSIDWDEEVAERGGFETFMLKEIYEQPEGFAETIGDRVRHGRLVLDGLGHDRGRAPRAAPHRHRRLRHRLPRRRRRPVRDRGVGRVPVEPDIASEWIYRNPVLDKDTLVIGISQSGETRDTIQAMQLARELGARTVAITNQMGSQITREVDSVLYTRTGLEVGVPRRRRSPPSRRSST